MDADSLHNHEVIVVIHEDISLLPLSEPTSIFAVDPWVHAGKKSTITLHCQICFQRGGAEDNRHHGRVSVKAIYCQFCHYTRIWKNILNLLKTEASNSRHIIPRVDAISVQLSGWTLMNLAEFEPLYWPSAISRLTCPIVPHPPTSSTAEYSGENRNLFYYRHCCCSPILIVMGRLLLLSVAR